MQRNRFVDTEAADRGFQSRLSRKRSAVVARAADDEVDIDGSAARMWKRLRRCQSPEPSSPAEEDKHAGGEDGSSQAPTVVEEPGDADESVERAAASDDELPPEAKEDEEDEEAGVLRDAPEGRAFDFHARHFGLTFSQVGDVTAQEAFKMISAEEDIEEVILARETHKDGGVHFHVFGSYNKKKHFRNAARHWDLVIRGSTLHPNIKMLNGKRGIGVWKRYCTKGGAFLSSMSVDLSTHRNFEQRMKDFDSWKSYGATRLRRMFCGSAEEKKGLNMFGMLWPDRTERQRSFWIWGPPETGKTVQARTAVKGYACFNKVSDKFPYEKYNGEEFIIIDDKKEPIKDELIHMLNGAMEEVDTPVYGETRYKPFLLAQGVRLRYLIISNDPPSYEHEEWFTSRFRVLNVRARLGDNEEASWVIL